MKRFFLTFALLGFAASLSWAADLAITATSVAPSTSPAITGKQTVGETLTAGQVVYFKTADSKLWKAQCDGGATEYAVKGIVLNGGSAEQSAQYQSSGDITIGATMTVGAEYYLSATAGGMCPRADLVTGNRIVRIGFAKTATVMALDIKDLGVAVP